MSLLRGAAIALGLIGAVGCVPTRGGWDASEVAARYPVLADSARLGDLAPHFLPVDGELVLFLCRWDTAQVVPVVLPRDADPVERELLSRALAAWEGAGLGIRFEVVPESDRGIHIELVQQGDPGPLPAGAGDTLADCAVEVGEEAPGRVSAQLVYASVHLRRDQLDWVERAVPLTDDERLGAALHELGHALGYSSHAAAGGSVMGKSPEVARRAGAALEAGEWSADPNLFALYALPSGVVVGRIPMDEAALATVDRFERIVATSEMDGPYTRVGDRGARVFYRDAKGLPVALRVRPWPTRRDGRALVLEPNARALQLGVDTGAKQPD